MTFLFVFIIAVAVGVIQSEAALPPPLQSPFAAELSVADHPTSWSANMRYDASTGAYLRQAMIGPTPGFVDMLVRTTPAQACYWESQQPAACRCSPLPPGFQLPSSVWTPTDASGSVALPGGAPLACFNGTWGNAFINQFVPLKALCFDSGGRVRAGVVPQFTVAIDRTSNTTIPAFPPTCMIARELRIASASTISKSHRE